MPPPPRLSRGGLYAYRARALAASTAALVTASCGSTITAELSEAGSEGGSSYSEAGSPFDAFSGNDASSFPDASSQDSSSGDEIVGIMYGLPFIDGGFPRDASSASDAAREAEPFDAPATVYGAPALDASERDVFIAPPYGIAPAYGLSP